MSGLTDRKEERVPCGSGITTRGLHVQVFHFHAALTGGTGRVRDSPRRCLLGTGKDEACLRVISAHLKYENCRCTSSCRCGLGALVVLFGICKRESQGTAGDGRFADRFLISGDCDVSRAVERTLTGRNEESRLGGWTVSFGVGLHVRPRGKGGEMPR
jgi:hypothetical protein